MGKKVDKEEYARVKTISVLIDLIKVFPEKRAGSLLLDFVKSDTYRLLYNYRTGYWSKNSDEILKVYAKEKGYILPYFEDSLIVKDLINRAKTDYERCFIVLLVLLNCCNLDNECLSELICKDNLVDYIVDNVKSDLDFSALLNYMGLEGKITCAKILEGEPEYFEKVRKYDVLNSKIWKFNGICKYLEDRFKNRNDLVSVVVKSKTFICLCETESDFWWKSENELCYLIDCELKGDMKAWEWQAF